MSTTKTTPTYELNLSAADMQALEDRARQMRAEALRHGMRTTGSWIKDRLAVIFGGSRQSA